MGSSPDRAGSRIRHGRALSLCAAAAALIWGGCSIEENYELLSFFFDGVPDPNAPDAADGGAASLGLDGVALGIVSSHSAYIDRRCTDCHAETAQFGFSVSGFSDLGNDVCLRCHEEVVAEHPIMHGPVAAHECLVCHEPHESAYPHLLSDPSPALCLKCHDFELRREPRQPVHEDLSRDCLQCHAGHGGSQRYFLDRWMEEGVEDSGTRELGREGEEEWEGEEEREEEFESPSPGENREPEHPRARG